MHEPPIVLYADRFWVSPYVCTAYVALREKGVPFDVRTLSLGDLEQRRGDYAEHALTERVPAIEHEGFWLSESSAIAEYLDDRFPPPGHPALLPTDVRQRARARQVMAWIRTDVLALRMQRPTWRIFYGEAPEAPLDAAGSAAAEKTLSVASRLVAEGATSLFDAWCIADVDLAILLQRLVQSGHAVSAKLRAYTAAQWSRPSLREYVERTRPDYVPYAY